MGMTEAAIQEKIRRTLLHHDAGGYSFDILWHAYDPATTETNVYRQASQMTGGKRFKPPVGLVGRVIENPEDERVGPIGDRQSSSARILFSRTEGILKGLIPDPTRNVTVLKEDDELEAPSLGTRFRIIRVDMTAQVAEFAHLIKVLAKDMRL